MERSKIKDEYFTIDRSLEQSRSPGTYKRTWADNQGCPPSVIQAFSRQDMVDVSGSCFADYFMDHRAALEPHLSRYGSYRYPLRAPDARQKSPFWRTKAMKQRQLCSIFKARTPQGQPEASGIK
jgi:hypothetical protein